MLSNSANTGRLFYMALWRNWLTLKRYRANFISELFGSALFGLGMLLFALAFDTALLEKTLGTTNWVSFMIFGVAYQSWQSVALWGAADMFRNELGSGQIDYTFTCPFSRYSYIICNVAAMAVRNSIFFIPMFIVGLWFTRETLTLPGLLLGLLATALSVGALAQMGVCFAALVLRHQQVSAIFGLFNFAFQMMTGMFVPLQVLPASLRLIGIVALPQSFGMDLLRHYTMGTQTVLDLPYEWAILIGQGVLYGLLAQLTVRRLERTARDQGLHYL
ncbi:MAG: ABC transporter permease [Anaerolineae bacterium]|nr:ABC transporter permease [Anaerolineae bacterium]